MNFILTEAYPKLQKINSKVELEEKHKKPHLPSFDAVFGAEHPRNNRAETNVNTA